MLECTIINEEIYTQILVKYANYIQDSPHKNGHSIDKERSK